MLSRGLEDTISRKNRLLMDMLQWAAAHRLVYVISVYPQDKSTRETPNSRLVDTLVRYGMLWRSSGEG